MYSVLAPVELILLVSSSKSKKLSCLSISYTLLAIAMLLDVRFLFLELRGSPVASLCVGQIMTFVLIKNL